MSRFLQGALAAVALVFLIGCASEGAKQGNEEVAPADTSAGAGMEGEPSPDSQSSTEESGSGDDIAANLAKLSDEDRAAAEKQKVCPVSDEALGSMGAPVKIELADGRSAFICCAGCEQQLRDEPDKYLAKLENKPEAGDSDSSNP